MMGPLTIASPLIRTARPDDAAAMAVLHACSFARPWDEAAMAAFLGMPGVLALLAAPSAETPPQGLLIARGAADEAELLSLCVLPAHRRQGLAQALLATAIVMLRAQGAKALFLEVEEGNQAALALYRGAGAVRLGLRRGYYEHGADAAIFSLAL